MKLGFRAMAAEDIDEAIALWRAANTARELPPSRARLRRVREKLRASDARSFVVHQDDDLVAMALLEPGRSEDGNGDAIVGTGHISMIFVHPSVWGYGVGSALLRCVHASVAKEGWTRLSVWTRASNQRAQRLYQSQGYLLSGREIHLDDDDLIVQFEWHDEHVRATMPSTRQTPTATSRT